MSSAPSATEVALQAIVETLQVVGHEVTILSDQLVVEPDFTAAVVWPLNKDEIPMNAAAVSVVGLFVGLARSEVKRSTDLFVEQSIEHGMTYAIIGPERPFATIAGAFIGIEHGIDPLGSVGLGLHDFSIFELEANVIEDGPLVARLGVELDRPVDALPDGRRKDFAVRNIAETKAGDHGNVFDREFQFRTRGP